jgi:hypothetical protein
MIKDLRKLSSMGREENGANEVFSSLARFDAY